MSKSELSARLQYFKMVHGVTLRAIGAFGDGDLDFRPRPGMRTPKELVFHIYTQLKVLAEGAQQGKLTDESAKLVDPENASVGEELSALATVSDLQSYAKACHDAAMSIYGAMSDEDLARKVESPFGTFPASRYFDFAYDEHWHHRGQLYTYLRLLGKEPPMLYDY